MTAAPSMPMVGLQTRFTWNFRGGLDWIERALEKQAGQLALWLPVAVGGGIAGWFALPHQEQWIALIAGGLGFACLGLALGWTKRSGQALFWGGICISLGAASVWIQAESARHMVLAKPQVITFEARILQRDDQLAKDKVRLLLAPAQGILPPKVRVSLSPDAALPDLRAGAIIELKARLMPPPRSALPGAYDFAPIAWFQQLGAVGQVLGPVKIVTPPPPEPKLRDRLTQHVKSQLEGSAAGIAAAFATGDRGGISEADGEAMRESGLTHLLSISGLHVTAAVGAAMFLSLRLLALFPVFALRFPIMIISAGVGAFTGVGYTLLTGAEVPTIRSCIAALLVLAGFMIGREALTLRLVATGALIILILWPQSLIGPSFQLSFAAITAIVAFHDGGWARNFFAVQDDGRLRKAARQIGALLMTGLVVEIALAPIALYHFHKSGIYGALANLIAIPLTTFIIMPTEALALLFDAVGLGAPFWWVTGQAIEGLLGLAHAVAETPGAVTRIPTMPWQSFAAFVAGGLWLCLWRGKNRLLGALPCAAAFVTLPLLNPPDLLITNDGRHLALRDNDGNYALLRERSGDFIRDVLAEQAAVEDIDALIQDQREADCSADLCTLTIRSAGRSWVIGATRSAHLVEWSTMITLCSRVDIMVSDRRLPKGCEPKWLKLDRQALAKSGGVAIRFSPTPSVIAEPPFATDHPWNERPIPHP
jgi:competence protein ComEC